MAFQLATCLAMGLTNTAAKAYGDAAIAAMGIVSRIITMGIYAVSGFAKGFMPIAGYNYGARQFKRVQTATKTALKWTSGFCVIFTAIMLIFAPVIIGLFTAEDQQVVEIGAFALRVNSITFAGMGIEAIYSMLSLALGKAAGGWLLSLGRQGLFFIPVILLLPRSIGMNGVIFAQPIADLLTLACMLILAIKLSKEIAEKERQKSLAP